MKALIMRRTSISLFILSTLAAVACGGRPEGWDKGFSAGDVVGLQSSVAVMDPGLNQAIVLESPSALGLTATYLPVGKSVVKTAASPHKDRLFVLSKGAEQRRKASDEVPRLTVIDTVPKPKVARVYDLDDQFSNLSLDPLGQWAVVHASAGLVENPNELLFVDLDHPEDEAHPRTIRSFGGRPARFTFTTPLSIAGVPRRIVVVQTEQDTTLIDLEDLDAPEITVRTPTTVSGAPSIPNQVVFHDADEDSDPVIAISFTNSTGVFLIGLVEGDAEHAFSLQINTIIEVGGAPSSIDFVETDGGLRLAALVPSAKQAALVDPKTAAVDFVPMPVGFSGLSRITDALEQQSPDSDAALLWTELQGVVGIWRLGEVVRAPYNSVETFPIPVGVGRVLDVPGPDEGACLDSGECFAQYKVVEGATNGDFYLLDLNRKQASLMVSNRRELELSLSPDGRRLWAFEQSGTDFAQVKFSNLHPIPLSAEVPILGVFDVGRPNAGSAEGDRSAIVVHDGSDLSATVFDGNDPDGAVTKFYSGISYGGLTK
jgi:hypothetical protein